MNQIALPEEFFPSGFDAWLSVVRCYEKAERRLAKRLEPLGLTIAQHDVLANLFVGDGVRQNELARRLVTTKGNVTGLLQRLEQRGLVERRPDPSDGRAQRVRLTRSGRRLAERALGEQREFVTALLAPLGRVEREAVNEAMGRVEARLEDL